MKRTWIIRGGISVVALAAVIFLAATWYYTTVLDEQLLQPLPWEPERDIPMLALARGRATFGAVGDAATEGVWGVNGANGYGQAGPIVAADDEQVQRAFQLFEGEIDVGESVAFDQYAFAGDPQTAFGIRYEDVRFTGELGGYPAWWVPGGRATWVVFVHGKGLDERRQALRIMPTIVDAGFPMLVMTYRNDIDAPPAEDGRYHWGLEEWRDVEAAVRFAVARGAEDIVLVGYSMGGEITSMFLHDSDLVDLVKGVIWDSPVLDLEAVVDKGAANQGVPGLLTASAKLLAGLRFDVQWDALDQVERAGEFDVPILLFHGTADETVPVATSNEFAELRPDLVTYERFEGGGHVTLWNRDPVRYRQAVLGFLDEVVPAE